MGWQDAPLVGGPQDENNPGWMKAPLAPQAPQQQTGNANTGDVSPTPSPPPGASSAPVSPSSASPPANLTYLPDFMSNWSRALDDAFTFGGADKVHSWLTGNDVATERAKTQAARAAIGPLGSLSADVAGYGMGGGSLGVGEKIAAGLGGRWLAGVAGAGLEGAGASAAGTIGHGGGPGDALKAAGIGGGLGALSAGVLGGVREPSAPLPPATSAADLRAQADQHWSALTGTPIANQAINQAIVKGRASILNDPSIAHLDQKDTLNTLADLQTQLMGMGTGAAARKAFAPVANLNVKMPGSSPATILNSAIDDLKGQGVPGNRAAAELENLMQATPAQGPAGQTNAFDLAQDAKDLSGRLKDVNRLGDWQSLADVAGGPDVGNQARQWLLSDQGQTFAKPGTPSYDALNALAATRNPNINWTPSGWDVRHVLHPVIGPLIEGGISAAMGGVGGYAHGQDPGTIAVEALAGGLTGGLLGFGLHRGVPAIQQKYFQGPAQQRAIDAARVALSTGQAQAPALRAAPIRDALRNLIFSQGARGAF